MNFRLMFFVLFSVSTENSGREERAPEEDTLARTLANERTLALRNRRRWRPFFIQTIVFSFYVFVYCVFGFRVYQELFTRIVTISQTRRKHVHPLTFLQFLSCIIYNIYIFFLCFKIKNYINWITLYFRFKFLLY